MGKSVIEVNNLSKKYRLGLVGTGTLGEDINRLWARMRGKEDPYSLVGEVNDRTLQTDGDYVWALKNVDFSLRQGEVLGIIGQNGAGKSTLLKILSRITTPSSGTVKINGRVGSLLEVGTGFHGELTGRENIYLNGAVLGMRKWEIDNKLDRIVDFSGVEKYLDTPVKRYSSGMKVRLGFAVAAHLEPEILIIDEVLAVGDAEFQNKAIRKMKSLTEVDGKSLIFVSHDLNRVEMLSDRCILMEMGSVLRDGITPKVINDYVVARKILSTQYRYSGEGKINYIHSLKIEKHKYEVNERLVVSISVEVNKTMSDGALSVQITNSRDVNVLHFLILRSEEGESSRMFEEKGRYQLKLDIPKLPLSPDNYNINVYLGDNSTKVNYDRVGCACSFEVFVPESLYRDYYWYSQSSIFVLESNWDVNRG